MSGCVFLPTCTVAGDVRPSIAGFGRVWTHTKLIQLLLAGLLPRLAQIQAKDLPWLTTCGKIGKLRCFQSSLEQTSAALNGPVSPAASWIV